MNTLLDTAELWLRNIASLSWKGALLTLAVGLVILLLRRHFSPAWRHGLWLLVLLRFALPDMGTSRLSMTGFAEMPATISEQAAAPIVPMPEFTMPREPDVSLSEAAAELPSITATAVPMISPLPPAPEPWTLWQKLTALWLLGAATVLGVMVLLHLRLLTRLRHDASAPTSRTMAVLREACELARVSRIPRLIVTDAIRAPALFGVLRPAILLPRELAASGDSASLKLIFLHELAHLQRRDLWAQIIASLIIALHWFNPVVWVAARRLRAEAEMAADAHALRYTDAAEAHRLGEVLLSFAHRAATGWMVWFTTATVLGISENKHDLRRRIEALMDIAKGRRTRWFVGLGVFSILAVVGLTKAPAEDAKKPQAAEAKPAPVSAVSTFWVTGKVTDKRTGLPIEGAQVFFGLEQKQSYANNSLGRFDWRFTSVHTSKTGEYRMPIKLRAAREIIVRAWAPDMTSSSQRIMLKDAGTTFDAEIEPVPLIPGKVVNASGQPVKDALVFTVEDSLKLDESLLPLTVENLRSQERKKLTQGRMIVSLGYSKEDGSVKLHTMDPLLREHQWIVALHPDHGMARVCAAKMKEGSTFKLEPWASLKGRLLDTTGTPVAKQKVTFFIEHALSMKLQPAVPAPLIVRQSVHVTTDDRGGFELTRMAPHTIMNGVEVSGKKHFLDDVAISSGPLTERSLSLKRFESSFSGVPLDPAQSRGIRGRVVLPPGYSLRSADYFAHLSLREVAGDSTPYARIQDDGSFTATVAAPGLYELSFMLSPRGGKSYSTPDSNRWMRFKVEPDPADKLLDVGEIRLEKKDFDFPPRPATTLNPSDYVEGPQGSGDVTVQDPLEKPLAGARIEVLDYLDIASQALGLEALAKQNPAVQTDAEGKARITFPRRPKPDLRVYGVKLRAISSSGAESRDLILVDGRKAVVKLMPATRLELRVTPSIVSWSLAGLSGLTVERRPLINGMIQAEVELVHNRTFMIQGITADGQELFSEALVAPVDGTFKADVRLNPGMEVTGQIQGMPAEGFGEGFVMCSVMEYGRGEQPALQKGNPPMVSWIAWARVGRDGSFRLPTMPRGRFLMIGGMGRGWITHDSTSYGSGRSDVMFSKLPASGPLKITLSTSPCADRQIQVFLPDGRPGAGVVLSSGYLGAPNSGTFLIKRNQPLTHRAEDKAAYADFAKASWPFGQIVADPEGRLTLPNLPKGEISSTIYWPLPGTDFPQSDRPKIIIPTDPTQVVTVRLIGKP